MRLPIDYERKHPAWLLRMRGCLEEGDQHKIVSTSQISPLIQTWEPGEHQGATQSGNDDALRFWADQVQSNEHSDKNILITGSTWYIYVLQNQA